MNENAANAFLKTLEEPPPKSVLILLTTEAPRVLETVVSRCLRLNFATEGRRALDPAHLAWLRTFSDLAAAEQKSLLGRYRLLDVILRKLNEMKEAIEKGLAERSPLERHPDAEKDLKEKWEEELKAAIESEYRRQRADLLVSVQWWLRDVWLHTLGAVGLASCLSPNKEAGDNQETCPEPSELLAMPEVVGSKEVAGRLSAREAMENLAVFERVQSLLHTNVQEALALEVGLLKLRL
jgi:DNA polymerase-3 subunit delta'